MNTNFNTTNRNEVYESGVNLVAEQYTPNGEIMVRSQNDPASNIDGDQRRLRILNSVVTIFENDDPSTSSDNSRLSDQPPTSQHADNPNQGFRKGTDLPTVQSVSAFESTEDDDCEFEIVGPDETERLWGITLETGGGSNVSSQVQTTLPLSNGRQSLILSDNNSSHYHTSNGDLGQSFYGTWDRTVFGDRMAGLSGSNQEKIIGSGLLATETSTGLEQLCNQYGMPDLTDQIPESTSPSQFPQIQTQCTDHPDPKWNQSQIPRKRAQTSGLKTTAVQTGVMNISERLSDLEDKSEMDEINRGSHNPAKRSKVAKSKYVSQPRVEQRSYCMSRVSVSLEEIKAIDPDYDKHPHKTFLPERMKRSQQTGMKTILLPTRMINLLNAHRQKAREEERKNYTGRKIPQDFKLRPVRHKDFEAFQAARRKEEETGSYENRQRRFANSRS
ncbi:hypothetical protein EAE99_010510 [Botrytis elliptica]|nr:hypothetical protein EAE99_010510 [Botrytis elliptica]